MLRDTTVMSRTLAAAARGAGLVALGLASHAAEDVSGSADPSAVERFPRSWIVEYTEPGAPEPYEFITAPVDRIKRDVRVEAVRVEGPLTRVTYRIPDGERLDDVIAHYETRIAAISPGIVFSCRGPDCGRSTIWANQIFGVAELAAPNRNQFYLAAPVRVDGQGQLVAFYAVQRGNRRVYAHLDIVVPQGPTPFDATLTLAGALERTGFVVVEGVEPDAEGNLSAEALTALDDLAGGLGELSGETFHVVCHVYGPRSVDALTGAAERCATVAAGRLEEAAGITAVAHGLGPIAPGGAGAASRVEVVLPNRLASD